MKKTDIKQLYQASESFKDKDVIVAGWVKSCRGMVTLALLTLLMELVLSHSKSFFQRKYS